MNYGYAVIDEDDALNDGIFLKNLKGEAKDE